MNTEKKRQPGEVGYNGVRKGENIEWDTPIKHHFEETPARKAIDKLKRGELLTADEDALLLTTAETSEVLTIIRGTGEDVSTRYIPQLVRDNRLQPAAPGSGRSYMYRLGDVRQVRFGEIGRPRKQTLDNIPSRDVK